MIQRYCIVCKKIIKKRKILYCSNYCNEIITKVNSETTKPRRKLNFIKGLYFEEFVYRKLSEKNKNVIKSKNSRGLFDITILKEDKILGLQVKFSPYAVGDYEVRIKEFLIKNPDYEAHIVIPNMKGGFTYYEDYYKELKNRKKPILKARTVKYNIKNMEKLMKRKRNIKLNNINEI